MAKLYIFGIGGTGSRVLRSFTLMLAAGVKIGVDEIVPIIIDPDHSNADLTRTVSLMNNYSNVRSSLTFSGGNANQFFKHEIRKVVNNYTLKIKDTDNLSFRDFIDLPQLDKANQAMMRMLFSEHNLQSSMEVGFKGNPNIGSVVLNQIVTSEDFEDFATSFSDGDKIFIISSIFGGTGASGFPLLLKTLRMGDSYSNFELIHNSEIGAVTIMPYFKLNQSEDSEIDSTTFISKTKSALAYYENNISKNNQIDQLYFLGDDMVNVYSNVDGGSAQQNDAHLIEFLAASAIFDFANNPNQSGTTINKEFGIKNIGNSITFNTFYEADRRRLYGPLTQFVLMSNCLTDEYSYFSSSEFNANNENFEGLYDSSFMTKLREFIAKYKGWLKELKGNKRSLDLFNLECGNKPFEVVTDVKPAKVASLYSDYSLAASWLNGSIKQCKSKTQEDKFMEMYYLGTQTMFNKKLNV